MWYTQQLSRLTFFGRVKHVKHLKDIKKINQLPFLSFFYNIIPRPSLILDCKLTLFDILWEQSHLLAWMKAWMLLMETPGNFTVLFFLFRISLLPFRQHDNFWAVFRLAEWTKDTVIPKCFIFPCFINESNKLKTMAEYS